MSLKERVTHEIEALREDEIEEVVEFLAFLRFRGRIKTATIDDEKRIASLYADFADEDRSLADEGISDYATLLDREDVA